MVATYVGGNNEIVRHRVTGLLVKANDRKSLVIVVVKLTKDDVMREKLGAVTRDLW